MDIEKTKTGCLKIPSKLFADKRGLFTELYKESTHSFLPRFKQENFSKSGAGVVRGLHAQSNNSQGKWIRLLKGEIIDFVIDMRINSSTYGHTEAFHMCAMEYSVYIPPGFLHGFWSLEECYFLYHCTTEYDPLSDGGVNPLDPSIECPWKNKNIIVTEKDMKLPLYKDYISNFKMENEIC